MENTPNSQPAFEDSIVKIEQVIKAEDLKLIKNNASITYMKLEIEKLQRATEEFNRNSLKLEQQTESRWKEHKELIDSNEKSRDSLELKMQTLQTMTQEYESFDRRLNEESNMGKNAYKEYMDKYEKVRRTYETYHSRYQQLKRIEIMKLKLAVEYKILQQKIFEEKKRIKQRCEIHQQIFRVTIVNFVKCAVDHWQARDLATEVKEAERQERELMGQLKKLQQLADEKERQMRMVKPAAPSVRESPQRKYDIPSMKFVEPTPLASTGSYLSTAFPVYSHYQYQEKALQFRTMCEQKRQQQQSQRRTFSSTLLNRRQISSVGGSATDQKRTPLLNMNSSVQMPLFKRPKVNILDIQSIASNEKPTQFNRPQHLKLSKVKENIPSVSVATKQAFAQNELQQNTSSLPPNDFPALQQYQTVNKFESSALKNKVTSQATPKRLPAQNYLPQKVCAPSQSRQTSNPGTSTVDQVVSQGKPSQASSSHSSHAYFSPPNTQQDNEATLQVNKTIHQEIPNYPVQASPDYFEPNGGSSQQIQGSKNSSPSLPLSGKDIVMKETVAGSLLYRSEAVPSQSQYGDSQQNNTPLQECSTEPCALVRSSITQNLTNMFLIENQPLQNQEQNESIRTSQSSTFSQKCHQLSQILAKDVPEVSSQVASATLANTGTNEKITSPFFHQPKAGEAVPQDQFMFGAQTVEQMLDNSALFQNPDASYNSNYVDNPIQFSPECIMNEEDDENMPAQQSEPAPLAFNFNFGQPSSSQPNENRPPFGNMFNMFP